MKLGEIFDRIYGEEDTSRSVATSIGGIFALVGYLIWQDGMLTILIFIIIFPITRVFCGNIRTRHLLHLKSQNSDEVQNSLIKSLTVKERDVLRAFIKAGGSVLTFSCIRENNIFLDDAGVRSLINREVLRQDFIDDMNEGLVLETELFDAATKYLEPEKK